MGAPKGSRNAVGNKGGTPPEATKFKAGKSGNPSGRPRSKIGHFLGVVGEELIKEGKQTNDESLARKAYEMALDGNLEAIRWITERKEGGIQNKLALSGELLYSNLGVDDLILALENRKKNESRADG